jgi:uncharacterized membrane protein YGL010W
MLLPCECGHPPFDLNLVPSKLARAGCRGRRRIEGSASFHDRLLWGVAASGSERGMSAYFRRQLAVYAEYHRDRWNCVMHVFGIVFLFLAAVLPFSAWPVPVLGAHITAATILLLPVLIYWLLLDAALGLAIAGAAVLLLSAATTIVDHVSAAGMWSITAAMMVIGLSLQVVGHQVFERRAPALKDNPTHLLLGPMFVMAKLFIALGFRHDLAVLMQHVPQGTPRSSSLFLEERQGEPHQHS